MAKPADRLLFYLPDSFPGNSQNGTYLFQCHRLFAIQAVVEFQDFGFPVLESGEGLIDRVGKRTFISEEVGKDAEAR